MFIPVLYISFLIHIFSTDYMYEDPAKCFGKTLFGYKLPNSGDILKLMVPNYSQKAISGWSNYPCMVISHEIDEKKMDNRGSKSVLYNTVKEQRVDGSWFLSNLPVTIRSLRYTLMGFERNYQIKIPSKQLNIKKFSTFYYSYQFNPWFWTGLIDAEGSFSIIIDKNKSRKLG